MSAEPESLREILAGRSTPVTDVKPVEKTEPATPSVASEEPAPEVKETKEAVRDDKGKFAKVEKTEPEKPAKEPLKAADVAAIIDERRKRQAAEERLAALQKDQPKPDFFADPDKAMKDAAAQATGPLHERLFKLSMKAARKAYEDFDAAAEAFASASDNDPRLVAGMRESEDPGEFIYTVGSQIKELADVGGDIRAYRGKVTKETQEQLTAANARIAALEAENTTLKTSQAELDTLPRSLNRTSSGAAPKAGEGDPESIQSIVRFNGNKPR